MRPNYHDGKCPEGFEACYRLDTADDFSTSIPNQLNEFLEATTCVEIDQ